MAYKNRDTENTSPGQPSTPNPNDKDSGTDNAIPQNEFSIPFTKKDVKDNVKEQYEATYKFNHSDLTPNKDPNYGQAPVVITRRYKVVDGKEVDKTDKIILYPIPQGDKKKELANLFAPMVEAGEDDISKYDSGFLGSCTATSSAQIMRLWDAWIKKWNGTGRPTKLLILHMQEKEGQEKITPIGEVGFNSYYEPGKTDPEILYWRVNNATLKGEIGNKYKGIMDVATVGFMYYALQKYKHIERFQAFILDANKPSIGLALRLSFTRTEEIDGGARGYYLTKEAFYKMIKKPIVVQSSR